MNFVWKVDRHKGFEAVEWEGNLGKWVKVKWKGELVGRKALPNRKKKTGKKKKRPQDEEKMMGFFNALVVEKAS